MEKIKPDITDLNEKDLEKEIRPKRPRIERGNLEQTWAGSLFGNGKLLAKIKDAIELKNIKNEDPFKDLIKISDLLDESDLEDNLSILNDAIS